ncbi:MAG: PD-(D/E)XK nuclease family protein, partial [Alistipes sp.]|nr:PD-(D/E)XK nuclease family protein [Alistipes sp.]
MPTFLEEVAQDLYARYGEQLASCRLLFPSRRARIFFEDALSECIERPMWQPHYTTIDELMSSLSGLHVGDKLRLVTELYKVYSTHHDEPFDKFYFWGEMLLSDFDMIDKYRIDADQLFTNITDLKELEADLSYLTERQQEIIRRFWSSLGPEESLTEQKHKFLRIWRSLPKIYHAFRRRLTELGIGYGGMLQRRALERLEGGEVQIDSNQQFIIAGFNALSTCERALFMHLKNNAKCDFYWDL